MKIVVIPLCILSATETILCILPAANNLYWPAVAVAMELWPWFILINILGLLFIGLKSKPRTRVCTRIDCFRMASFFGELSYWTYGRTMPQTKNNDRQRPPYWPTPCPVFLKLPSAGDRSRDASWRHPFASGFWRLGLAKGSYHHKHSWRRLALRKR
jgi:hypothetical protein